MKGVSCLKLKEKDFKEFIHRVEVCCVGELVAPLRKALKELNDMFDDELDKFTESTPILQYGSEIYNDRSTKQMFIINNTDLTNKLKEYLSKCFTFGEPNIYVENVEVRININGEYLHEAKTLASIFVIFRNGSEFRKKTGETKPRFRTISFITYDMNIVKLNANKRTMCITNDDEAEIDSDNGYVNRQHKAKRNRIVLLVSSVDKKSAKINCSLEDKAIPYRPKLEENVNN